MARISNGLYEIRWHGRGGQGAVTGAQILAEAAFLEGLWCQAFPFFGAERRGAPVTAYTRISKKPILVHSAIYSPDLVIVLDPSIMSIVDVTKGLKENGTLLVNSREIPKIERDDIRVFIVDATSISLELDLLVAGIPVVNTPMTGAAARVLPLIGLESVLKAVHNKFIDSLGPEKTKLNVEAAKRAYDKVREV